jgi:hypothetical protein
LYRTEPVAAMLPLDVAGWVEPLPVPVRPVPLGAGLAGGVVAVRLGDLAVADGVAGPVLVPRTDDRSVAITPARTATTRQTSLGTAVVRHSPRT